MAHSDTMHEAKKAGNETKRQAKRAGYEAKPWVKRMARFGYAAKGTVYILIGVLAVMAAFGPGGKTTGSTGALKTVASKPYGNVLLWIIGIGLVGYVIWRLIQAFKDPEHPGHDSKRIIARISYFVSAVIYGALAYKAISIAMQSAGSGSSGGSSSKQTLTAKLLSQPFGQWIIGIIGAIIIGYGIYQLYSGYKEKFAKRFKINQMSNKEIRLGKKAGKMGLMARGVVFSMIGYFFIQTAMTANSNNAKGLSAALSEIAQQPFGKWLLALVAIGLVMYGIFQVLKGKNRHMSVV
ncbi:DUF1206 domain-containing protein [Bacillus tianshenii]|nr:DUF1206 domain-containing protein [Bacillus tianshenii]